MVHCTCWVLTRVSWEGASGVQAPAVGKRHPEDEGARATIPAALAGGVGLVRPTDQPHVPCRTISRTSVGGLRRGPVIKADASSARSCDDRLVILTVIPTDRMCACVYVKNVEINIKGYCVCIFWL